MTITIRGYCPGCGQPLDFPIKVVTVNKRNGFYTEAKVDLEEVPHECPDPAKDR